MQVVTFFLPVVRGDNMSKIVQDKNNWGNGLFCVLLKYLGTSVRFNV